MATEAGSKKTKTDGLTIITTHTNADFDAVGSLLAALIFHEAYHAGQIAILRRTYGKDSVIK